jgi:hypothetical protein
MSRSTYLRRVANRFLKHTYTLTTTEPVLDEDEQPTFDDNGNQIYENSDPVTDKPCLFLWEEVLTTDERGSNIARTPTLYVMHDDTILEGDNVSSVEDEDGTILISSATVQTINPTAEAGGAVLKVCRLVGAVTA